MQSTHNKINKEAADAAPIINGVRVQIMWKTILLLGATLAITSCNNLDEGRIPGAQDFSMRSNLMCTIEQSSDRSEIDRKISLIGIDTEQPKILFEGHKGESSGTSPMKKIFETSDALTLQLVASLTGSVDTFVIDKKSGKFARAAAGNLAGVYASASLGSCE